MIDTHTNRETETIAQIERYDVEVRHILKRIEHARADVDRRVLNKQLGDIKIRIDFLRRSLK